MEALMAYGWPGNVRELENVIERALILTTGSTLQLAQVQGRAARWPDAERLDDAQRAHIQRVLDACGWRIEGRDHAAQKLGLKPSTLRSQMQKLGITRRARRA
jgi:formate hydrogenlyase transcriptional activator